MKSHRITILLLLFLLATHGLQAQEAISASGSNASSSSGSVSYTVGQIAYSINSEAEGLVTEGIQQAYEVYVITANESIAKINLLTSVFPNPTTDLLTLKVNNPELSNLYYYLFDMSGKMLENNKILDSNTSIQMGNYIPASYFLKVMQSKNSQLQEIKTFKIIKN